QTGDGWMGSAHSGLRADVPCGGAGVGPLARRPATMIQEPRLRAGFVSNRTRRAKARRRRISSGATASPHPIRRNHIGRSTMFIGLPRAPQIVAILVTCLALSFAIGAVPPASAQDVASGARIERSLPDVLEEITPAVVNIAVTSRASAETNPLFNDPYF